MELIGVVNSNSDRLNELVSASIEYCKEAIGFNSFSSIKTMPHRKAAEKTYNNFDVVIVSDIAGLKLCDDLKNIYSHITFIWLADSYYAEIESLNNFPDIIAIPAGAIAQDQQQFIIKNSRLLELSDNKDENLLLIAQQVEHIELSQVNSMLYFIFNKPLPIALLAGVVMASLVLTLGIFCGGASVLAAGSAAFASGVFASSATFFVLTERKVNPKGFEDLAKLGKELKDIINTI